MITSVSVVFIVLSNRILILAVKLLVLSFVHLSPINLEDRSKPCENLTHLFVPIINCENIESHKRNNCNCTSILNSPIVKFFSIWLLINQS